MANPFVHMELMTTDVKVAKKFFGELFDWKLEEVKGADNIPYTMINVGNGAGGGIMANPMPKTGSLWVPHIEVDDVRAATEKAKALGGQVMKPVTEVEGMGEFSIILDPTGGMFGLWEAKSSP